MITFDDYVRLRGARLVRLARLLIKDRHLAEDLVQEVLGKAFVRWKKIAATDDPDMYVRRMLVNANISWWRRRSSSEVATGTISDRPDDADPMERAAGRDAAWRLIADLPPKQRATIVLGLIIYGRLTDTSIGKLFLGGIVPGFLMAGALLLTVRSQAMRALDKLRRRLEESPASIEGRLRR